MFYGNVKSEKNIRRGIILKAEGCYTVSVGYKVLCKCLVPLPKLTQADVPPELCAVAISATVRLYHYR